MYMLAVQCTIGKSSLFYWSLSASVFLPYDNYNGTEVLE